MRTPTSKQHRVGAPAPLGLVAATLLVLAACGDFTGPGIEGGETFRPTPRLSPAQSVYSLNPGGFATLSTEVDEAVAGSRWCGALTVWFETATESCLGRSDRPPFGQALVEDGDLRLLTGVDQAAPFVWTGPPGRINPFPESGDFTVDIRMTVEQLGSYDMGLSFLYWNPAETVGNTSPFSERVMQVWARSKDGIRVLLVDDWVAVDDPLEPHAYRVVYEDGAYTLFVDDQYVVGPIPSDRRPTAIWMGNPSFLFRPGEWSDVRISQLTVSTPESAVVEVPVDVKPGGCPSPVSLRAKGMLPVAITGTDALDVTQIDPSTLRLEGVAPVRHSFEDVASPVEPYVGKTIEDCTDVGRDRVMDLVAKFPTAEVADAIMGAARGEERTLTLTGNLLPEFGGTPFVGEDIVVVR
jgi:hypothetical protein